MSLSTQPPPPGSRRVLELSEEAGALLDLLVELGHLDDAMLTELNDRLLDLDAPTGLVSLQDVRRMAATLIFEQMESLDGEQRRVLKQEWRLLFW